MVEVKFSTICGDGLVRAPTTADKLQRMLAPYKNGNTVIVQPYRLNEKTSLPGSLLGLLGCIINLKYPQAPPITPGVICLSTRLVVMELSMLEELERVYSRTAEFAEIAARAICLNLPNRYLPGTSLDRDVGRALERNKPVFLSDLGYQT